MTHDASRDDILIIDDEAPVRTFLERVVRTIPHTATRLAASASEALSLAEAEAPALMISDLNMPGKRGDWLVTQVRARGWTMPFVLHTGSIREGEEARLLQLGVTRVIRKPAAPVVLRNVMIELLSRNVHFELVAEAGSEVFVSGTFNDWNPRQWRMHEEADPGFFSTTVRLPRGRHEYKFVVNGQWHADAKCVESVRNAYGSMNSVIHV